MKTIRSRQFGALAAWVAVYLLAAVAFIYTPANSQSLLEAMDAAGKPRLPLWQIALGNAGIIVGLYLPLGAVGLWLAQRSGLPGVYRPGDTPRQRYAVPLGLGVVVGLVLVALEQVVVRLGYAARLPHPGFPASIWASLTAGIGEEIIFRLFLMSLWLVIFRRLLRGLADPTRAHTLSFYAANLLAALAFGAGHLGTMMVLAGVSTPAELPAVMVLEAFVLNGLLGWVAGLLCARSGVVAAMGVHFWTDMVWHVVYGVL